MPYTNTFLDQQAQERSMDNCLGWFLEPVVRGDYPFSMRASAKDRVPYFKEIEQEKLVGSYDMIGIKLLHLNVLQAHRHLSKLLASAQH